MWYNEIAHRLKKENWKDHKYSLKILYIYNIIILKCIIIIILF